MFARIIIALLITAFLCPIFYALSNQDLQFLTEKEQFDIILKYPEAIVAKLVSGNKDDLQLVLTYAQRADLPALAMQCHKRLAKETGSLEDALQWLLLKKNSDADSLEFAMELHEVAAFFPEALDKQVFSHYAGLDSETSLDTAIQNATSYNSVVEAMAKSIIDEISTTRNDSLALQLISDFQNTYPHSQYAQIALYYKLYHLSNAKNWDALFTVLPPLEDITPVEAYISALYLVSPTLRKNFTGSIQPLVLAAEYLEKAKSSLPQTLLYDLYTSSDWQSRVTMLKAKLLYYKLLSENNLYGDEEQLEPLPKLSKKAYRELEKTLGSIFFSNNDRGERAELCFWKAKNKLLQKGKKPQQQAARLLTECLIYGAPRKRYDNDALKLITTLHKQLQIKEEPLAWMRNLMKYQGIVYYDISEAAGLKDKRYSRVALGDFNSDGKTDILFSGKFLYENQGNLNFSDVTEAVGLTSLNSSGGLFADFNKDGLLDILSYSHSSEDRGDQLLKNMDNKRFVNVNERAGDIDDSYPTEAAAWIDTAGKGFPSLYMTNYEKWQERSGYPDFFWQNQDGYFSDKSIALGFRLPDYTDNPGQAGRGAAPADFDNDGFQEILVTNYRLNRNFCWKQANDVFVDVAPLYGLSGIYKKGYFGHSIGADWGDFDNDGDLDLFIANLAHPRFLDISDTSMLLRNDGLAYHIVENDTIYYWKFTDVTKSAGITYDELHSDPMFFDADNDGFLDLFITSVYENDRSYLYRNKGDGTFEDVSWLSGARIYNGWGNACADLDRDGLLDLVVGSGNGAKILHNRTQTANKSLTIKPVWKNDKIHLESDPENFSKLPNSPAFGCRVIVTAKTPQGMEISYVRELSSAKGTGSQNAQELHFGLGRNSLIGFRRFEP